MGEPYRVPGIVEPLPVDPDERLLRLARARPFADEDRRCPYCNWARYSEYNGPQMGRICYGPRRWWRPWGCALFTPHFHVKCATCAAKWIMAPATAKLA